VIRVTDDSTGSTGKTFTQAEVDAIVRDRLKREREATATKYADYDDLRSKAADADKNKTQLDQVLEKLTKAEERTAKLETAQTRSSVITAKKLPASLAKWLPSSGTEEELTSKADELLADWKAAGGKVDGETDGNTEQDGDKGTGTPPARPAAAPGRPREDLRSGAPATARQPEETDPLKLAALIPRI
jgi:hypothetical protein